MTIKIVVDGKGGVGRSTMCMKFFHSECLDDELECCLENSWKKQVNHEGKEYTLEVTDSEDCEDKVTEDYYKNADCLIFIYSIIDKESLTCLEHKYKYHQELTDNKSVPVLLVGNKLDEEDKREVTLEEVEKLSKNFGNCTKVIEISVKNNGEVKVFQEILNLYLKK